jgi:predicted nucleic acid-binding protein
VVVADTGAILALIDADDVHHEAMNAAYAADPEGWLLPWAILPEVDYLVGRELGEDARRAWVEDLASGAFWVEWGRRDDLVRARAIDTQYRALELGLVDSVVMAIAERLGASIATVDLRHFGAVHLAHAPRLLPRDVASAPRPRKRR